MAVFLYTLLFSVLFSPVHMQDPSSVMESTYLDVASSSFESLLSTLNEMPSSMESVQVSEFSDISSDMMTLLFPPSLSSSSNIISSTPSPSSTLEFNSESPIVITPSLEPSDLFATRETFTSYPSTIEFTSVTIEVTTAPVNSPSLATTNNRVSSSTAGPPSVSEIFSLTFEGISSVDSLSLPTTSDTVYSFTSGPLISEFSSVTPGTVTSSLESPSLSVASDTFTVTSSAVSPSSASEPPSMLLEPPSMTSEPPSMISEPTSVTSEPPSVTSEPPSMTSMTSEPSSVPSATSAPSTSEITSVTSEVITSHTGSVSPSVTVKDQPPSSMPQGELSESERQLAIAMPVSVAGYITILIILAIFVSALRRRRGKKQKKDNQVYDYSAMYTGIEAATVFGNEEVEDEHDDVYKPKPTRLTFRPKIPTMSNPLTISELGALLKNEQAVINEFENIPTNLVSMDDVPPGAENKNRYRNILPNPHTRVPLFLKFGVANSDYINANYIRGYIGTPRSYISTQGPLWNTTPDFWRMIWEQRSCIIVMVTELTENGMAKCHQYWPDEQEGRTAVYDDIEVTLAKRVIEQSSTTTTFLLRHLEKGVTREVLHFWFRAWPDHDVPDSAEPFLNFVQSVRSASGDLPVGPITAHCSAGIGRSGVFLTTLLGMETLEESNEVDILKTVSTMRQDRGGMVQNKSQYLFIHKALYQYALWLERSRAPTKSFLGDDFHGTSSHVKLLDED